MQFVTDVLNMCGIPPLSIESHRGAVPTGGAMISEMGTGGRCGENVFVYLQRRAVRVCLSGTHVPLTAESRFIGRTSDNEQSKRATFVVYRSVAFQRDQNAQHI